MTDPKNNLKKIREMTRTQLEKEYEIYQKGQSTRFTIFTLPEFLKTGYDAVIFFIHFYKDKESLFKKCKDHFENNQETAKDFVFDFKRFIEEFSCLVDEEDDEPCPPLGTSLLVGLTRQELELKYKEWQKKGDHEVILPLPKFIEDGSDFDKWITHRFFDFRSKIREEYKITINDDPHTPRLCSFFHQNWENSTDDTVRVEEPKEEELPQDFESYTYEQLEKAWLKFQEKYCSKSCYPLFQTLPDYIKNGKVALSILEDGPEHKNFEQNIKNHYECRAWGHHQEFYSRFLEFAEHYRLKGLSVVEEPSFPPSSRKNNLEGLTREELESKYKEWQTRNPLFFKSPLPKFIKDGSDLVEWVSNQYSIFKCKVRGEFASFHSVNALRLFDFVNQNWEEKKDDLVKEEPVLEEDSHQEINPPPAEDSITSTVPEEPNVRKNNLEGLTREQLESKYKEWNNREHFALKLPLPQFIKDGSDLIQFIAQEYTECQKKVHEEYGKPCYLPHTVRLCNFVYQNWDEKEEPVLEEVSQPEINSSTVEDSITSTVSEEEPIIPAEDKEEPKECIEMLKKQIEAAEKRTEELEKAVGYDHFYGRVFLDDSFGYSRDICMVMTVISLIGIGLVLILLFCLYLKIESDFSQQFKNLQNQIDLLNTTRSFAFNNIPVFNDQEKQVIAELFLYLLSSNQVFIVCASFCFICVLILIDKYRKQLKKKN